MGVSGWIKCTGSGWNLSPIHRPSGLPCNMGWNRADLISFSERTEGYSGIFTLKSGLLRFLFWVISFAWVLVLELEKVSVIICYFFNYHLWLLGLGWRPGRGGVGERTGAGRLGEQGVVVDKGNVHRWQSLWQKPTWLFA